uniref:Putative product n=1 Tax=Xenopsylla cheopis TaxID=163159 RepID=A0A6M2E194_XENCH
MQEKTLINKYATILLVVCAYWVISILTVFINKILLSSQEVNLDAPLFITWFQCLVSSAICYFTSVTLINTIYLYDKYKQFMFKVCARLILLYRKIINHCF